MPNSSSGEKTLDELPRAGKRSSPEGRARVLRTTPVVGGPAEMAALSTLRGRHAALCSSRDLPQPRSGVADTTERSPGGVPGSRGQGGTPASSGRGLRAGLLNEPPPDLQTAVVQCRW
jgi:hypothetical protein